MIKRQNEENLRTQILFKQFCCWIIWRGLGGGVGGEFFITFGQIEIDFGI